MDSPSLVHPIESLEKQGFEGWEQGATERPEKFFQWSQLTSSSAWVFMLRETAKASIEKEVKSNWKGVDCETQSAERERERVWKKNGKSAFSVIEKDRASFLWSFRVSNRVFLSAHSIETSLGTGKFSFTKVSKATSEEKRSTSSRRRAKKIRVCLFQAHRAMRSAMVNREQVLSDKKDLLLSFSGASSSLYFCLRRQKIFRQV